MGVAASPLQARFTVTTHVGQRLSMRESLPPGAWDGIVAPVAAQGRGMSRLTGRPIRSSGRGESHPPALRSPHATLASRGSCHPANGHAPSPQWTRRVGSRLAMSARNLPARFGCLRSFLYFRKAQRTRYSLIRRSGTCGQDGWWRPLQVIQPRTTWLTSRAISPSACPPPRWGLQPRICRRIALPASSLTAGRKLEPSTHFGTTGRGPGWNGSSPSPPPSGGVAGRASPWNEPSAQSATGGWLQTVLTSG